MKLSDNNENFLNNLRNNVKNYSRIKSKRGKLNFYLNMNMAFDFFVSHFENDNYIADIPYLGGIGIYNKYEANSSVYYFKDLSFVSEVFKTIELSVVAGLGDKFCNTLLIPVYVKDLMYVYMTLKKYIKFTDIFSIKGAVVYCRYGIFEFRCLKSYDNITVENRFSFGFEADDKLRTPVSFLESDIYKKLYDNLITIGAAVESISRSYGGKIPVINLTNVGLVKDKLHQYCYNRNSDISQYLLPIQSVEEYKHLKGTPSGGICAYNPEFVKKTIEDVYCFDFTSFYPSLMYFSDEFPVSFEGIVNDLDEEKYIKYAKQYACVGSFVFVNLRLKVKGVPFIKSDNVDINSNNCTYNKDFNLIKGDLVLLNLTDFDFKTLKRFYDFDGFHVNMLYLYKRGRLPKSLVACMLDYYKIKTRYKGVAGYEHLESTSKVAVNTIYGLMLIDPCKIYDSFDPETNNVIKDKHVINDADIMERIDQYNKDLASKKKVSCYHWGIYIASIARYKISHFIKRGMDLGCWIYSDTDSCYFTYNDELFKEIDEANEIIIQEGINLEKFFSKFDYIQYNDNNDMKFLGAFEYDKCYKYFKCLGKKQYITYEDELSIKVAGLTCAIAERFFKNIDIEDAFLLFSDNLVVPRCKPVLVKLKEQTFKIHDMNGKSYTVHTEKDDVALIYDSYTFGKEGTYENTKFL